LVSIKVLVVRRGASNGPAQPFLTRACSSSARFELKTHQRRGVSGTVAVEKNLEVEITAASLGEQNQG
jgi:hypothetical protein